MGPRKGGQVALQHMKKDFSAQHNHPPFLSSTERGHQMLALNVEASSLILCFNLLLESLESLPLAADNMVLGAPVI